MRGVTPFVPARVQPPLPLDRFVATEERSPEALDVDVVVVGAGPSGLSFAIELMRRAKEAGRETSVAVLEKAEEVGQHCLSGAVVNPVALRELFPGVPDADLPLRAPVT